MEKKSLGNGAQGNFAPQVADLVAIGKGEMRTLPPDLG